MSEELALLDRILELSVPRIYSAERAGEVAGEKNEAIKALRQRLEALRAERDALDRQLDGARGCLAEQTSRAEKAEAERDAAVKRAEAAEKRADEIEAEHDADQEEIAGWEHDLRAALDRAEKAEAENARLREALAGVLPPPHGLHGGPLVQMVATYEDGSDEGTARHRGRISREAVERARAALAPVENKGGNDGE